MIQYARPVRDLVRERSSWRTFDGRPLSGNTIGALKQFIGSLPGGPFGNRPRFMVASASESDVSALRGMGTYGVIRGARDFIIGAVTNAPMAMVDYGYLMEAVILHVTDLGLGSCWLGGTFKSSAFADTIDANESEVVPAIVPVGHRAGKRGIVDSLIRWSAGSKKRKPWEDIFFYDTPDSRLNPEAAGRFSEPLEMVRLAPSASNKQPWRIVMEKGQRVCHVFLERDPAYTEKYPALQEIDMGIALCHFELTARENSCSGGWERLEKAPSCAVSRWEYIISWDVSA